MAKILLLNPNKWGRGITHIWIASHSSILKKKGHQVELFDCTFYEDWTENELEFATSTGMFQPTDYNTFVQFKKTPVLDDLQSKIDDFDPDIIFWSAISSHIHSEGEYVNIQNGYELIGKVRTRALKITGGLQATSAPLLVFKNFDQIDYLISGESEFVLQQIANSIDEKKNFTHLDGLVSYDGSDIKKNKPQKIIHDLDLLSPYDYSIFEDQVFYRPYNGKVVRAVDYELSRGCIYSCSYCVETIIQKYYGFNNSSEKTGAITNFKSYLRHKSAKMIFKELSFLNKEKKINFIRCQDTNFLTNDKNTLLELSELLTNSTLDFKLYIETRPEGINEKSIELLKKLNVDGIGMGVELASEEFRKNELNRFASQSKTINAFNLLKSHGIKRTSYNVIGFPNQTEESIMQTIEFNKILSPDNITVAYYSPYYGTGQHEAGVKSGVFDNYELSADAALRSTTRSNILSKKKLEFYKKNFISLVKSE